MKFDFGPQIYSLDRSPTSLPGRDVEFGRISFCFPCSTKLSSSVSDCPS